MDRLASRALLALTLVALPLAAQAATQVGSAAAVRNDIRGSIAGRMSNGSPVHQSETVSSAADSSAQLVLFDNTSLTLGPSSRVKIDKFVYDPSPGRGEVAVNLIKGALRFVSGEAAGSQSGEAAGSQAPPGSVVRTPVFGLNGLDKVGEEGEGSPPPGGGKPPSFVAEAFVSDLGYTLFVLIEGGMEVCSASGCKQVTTPGQFVVGSPDGAISQPTAWPGPMLDITASADFAQTYFATHLERGNDVLPRYRDLNDALKSRDFTAPCIEGPEDPPCPGAPVP